MNGWIILNYLVWGVSGLILTLILIDFIRVELRKKQTRDDKF